ncbi:MAG: YecA family protein [Nitrosomonadaceae bacterium]|nr:YecA family protein [Nitrosomonadaceae bacterium]
MSKSTNNSGQLLPLSQEEMNELDDFLMSDITSNETMALDMLDGYLTAIVSGPVTLKLDEWLPGIWGPTKDDMPMFKNMEQAQHILQLILRHMNGIIWMLQDDPDTFEPVLGTRIYRKREYIDGEMWAYGYMQGIELCRQQWQSFFDDPNGVAALRPIHLLGSDDVTPEEESLTDTPKQREELSKQIPASVAWIYRYWLPYRQAVYEQKVASTIQRSHPKIGRNDPCPCGSGLKFKKCCGVAASLH